jgi:hypothetical protein
VLKDAAKFMGIPSPAILALSGWGYALSRFGPVPVVDGAPAERREPELVPRGNLSTMVVPVPLDAYLHVVMADLTAHDLRLDRLFIYLYETRPLQH